MKGSCLCGGIQVETADEKEVGICHCTICRRWTGGPMFAVHAGNEVTFSGIKPATYASSAWAERGFCPQCGTLLFYHLLSNNEYVLTAGLFQNQSFEFTSEIFIDEKPDWYSFSNNTRKLTGQQVIDQYSTDD